MKFVTKDNSEFGSLERALAYEERVSKMETRKKSEELLKDLESVKLPKLPKVRSDKGKKRASYTQSVPKRFVSYRRIAIARKVPFSLSVEELENLLSQTCDYCGGSVQMGVRRINTKSGYTPENVVPCCHQCNMMQSVYPTREFLKKVKEIYNHLELGK